MTKMMKSTDVECVIECLEEKRISSKHCSALPFSQKDGAQPLANITKTQIDNGTHPILEHTAKNPHVSFNAEEKVISLK